jgi:NCS1 family nucleobase:cation symporter-1
MTFKAGGLGPLLEDHGTVGWSLDKFWFGLFPPALMGMIAFWSTLSLNMPDFTRFGKSQRTQAVGQALGLPTTMTVFPLIAVLVTSAALVVFPGEKPENLFNPVYLVGLMNDGSALGLIVVLLSLVTLGVATLSVNVAANIVSPSYDFSNAWPKRISFRTGGIITGVVGILIQPWMLYSNPDTYIFTWLGTYGGATGAIAGVLIADYWYLRKTNLKLGDLYRTNGAYRYSGGWNWNAVIALLVGIVLAIGGSYSANGQPFPVDGVIPLLKPLADYSWVVGLIVSFVVYIALMRFMPRSRPVTESEMAGQPA